jgi:GNAT superfamily N-acetyltransferase
MPDMSTSSTAHDEIVLRDPQPGDIGWVIARHGAIYAKEYGWNAQFEALVAEVAAAYLRKHDPKCERAWIAEYRGEKVGCIFLVRYAEDTAKLRLLLVEPEARGLGVGRRLVEECLAFAKRAGYARVILWTNNVLHSARKIYEAFGFRLIHSETNNEFGPPNIAETWELRFVD